MKTDNEILRELSDIIQSKTGVQLGEKQRHMVDSRIRKRILDLKLGGLSEYYAFFLKMPKQETIQLVSLLTTHHTYFFREFSHFEFLESTALPKLIPAVRARSDKTLRVWSAACSRGQEVYSLAMFLTHYLGKHAPDLKFEILGTDIDPDSVHLAKNGVYHYTEIKEVPSHFLSNHWARGSGDIADYVKAKKTLRDHTRFDALNLMESEKIQKFPSFDVVFCRNVFIYFTLEQIKSISTQILKRLTPEGYFFIGISETLHGLNLDLSTLGPSIYQNSSAKKSAPTSSPAIAVPSLPNPIRVLCVDDSPTVLTLLKGIFSKAAGFEIVGTAINGLDASKKVAELKPDVMTLDIHMPEQTGIEYLQKNMNSKHIPVVMVSSVSRENADLASRALELGASDYIEKPALNQLSVRTDEIQTKVRCAVRNAVTRTFTEKTSIHAEFKRRPIIPSPEQKLRLVFGGAGDRERIAATLKEGVAGPGFLVLLENPGPALPEMAKAFAKSFGKQVRSIETAALPGPGEIFIADFTVIGEELRKLGQSRQNTVFVYGQPSKRTVTEVKAWAGVTFLEETGSPNPFGTYVKDIFPSTSFVALSDEYLSGVKATHPKAKAA